MAHRPDSAARREPVAGADRRRHPRAQLDLVVRLRFGSIDQFLSAHAQDVSIGGMFLRGQHAGPRGALREVGQLLALQFDAGNERLIEGLGKIVRVVQPAEPGGEGGVGIQFVNLDPASLELIEAIVSGTFRAADAASGSAGGAGAGDK